jgi:predicted nucleic acid-binding protein
MMAFLLDANVLIALIDPARVQHDPAHEWFLPHRGSKPELPAR